MLVFDLYLTIINIFAIIFLPLILFVLFKRNIVIIIIIIIIIITFLFFLITRVFKIVLRSCCSCLFREGQNSRGNRGISAHCAMCTPHYLRIA